MTEIFRLREGDRGRPITDIATLLTSDDLRRDATEVSRELVNIIQRRAAAGRTALLSAELDHRVKNILAVFA